MKKTMRVLCAAALVAAPAVPALAGGTADPNSTVPQITPPTVGGPIIEIPVVVGDGGGGGFAEGEVVAAGTPAAVQAVGGSLGALVRSLVGGGPGGGGGGGGGGGAPSIPPLSPAQQAAAVNILSGMAARGVPNAQAVLDAILSGEADS